MKPMELDLWLETTKEAEVRELCVCPAGVVRIRSRASRRTVQHLVAARVTSVRVSASCCDVFSTPLWDAASQQSRPLFPSPQKVATLGTHIRSPTDLESLE